MQPPIVSDSGQWTCGAARQIYHHPNQPQYRPSFRSLGRDRLSRATGWRPILRLTDIALMRALVTTSSCYGALEIVCILLLLLLLLYSLTDPIWHAELALVYTFERATSRCKSSTRPQFIATHLNTSRPNGRCISNAVSIVHEL